MTTRFFRSFSTVAFPKTTENTSQKTGEKRLGKTAKAILESMRSEPDVTIGEPARQLESSASLVSVG